MIGAAVAGGVDTGTVDVYATPEQTSGKVAMKLQLEMDVNGNQQLLQSPLFFEVELPEG